ncbi:MAG: glycosyltransferase family 10 domain-containing protein [Chlamydiales bacterium]
MKSNEKIVDQKKILLSITSQNKPFLVSKYLSHIDNLNYDKKLITVYINTSKSDETVKQILSEWAEKHANDYKNIIVDNEDDSTNSPIEIRNKSLQKVKETGSDYYFSVEHDCLITPGTLKTLIKTNKPIVSPLLHVIPGANEVFGNYFCAVSDSGYFENHPGFFPILHRTMIGTFKVPLVFKVYLIQANAIDQLGRLENANEYDFIVLARQARLHNIDQYICNEQEFGVVVRLGEENEAEKFAVIEPYINAHQQHEKKIIYIEPNYWGDIFNPNSVCYNMKSWMTLRSVLQAAGYDLIQTNSFYNVKNLETLIDSNLGNFEKLIVFEIFGEQLKLYSKYPKEKLVLIVWEPPNVKPESYNSADHKHFSKVYTWRDDLVDHEKYRKIFYPDQRPMRSNPFDFETKKLAVIVAGNKSWNHPNQLCQERFHTIDFYEKHHPEELDLYGMWWPSDYKVYKGKIGVSTDSTDNKIDALKSYKFSYSYENVKGEPGYITEKIFNCFEAGCVPIYWGAPNVTKYIPKNCFIDRRDFVSDEDLYRFLKNMTKEEHEEYVNNINNYLSSEQVKLFSIDNFVKNLMGLIIPELQSPPPKQQTIEKTVYEFSKEPIDVVILCTAKDQDKLELCIQGVKDNCNQARRIIVVSPTPLTDKAEWFDEKKFPFNMRSVGLEMFSHNESIAQGYSVDRYYQQLLRLYAPYKIPNISSNVLTLDANTIFVNPVEWLGSNRAGLYHTVKASDELNFVQCRRLIPGFKRAFPDKSVAMNFMLFQRPVVEDLFKTIKDNQYIEPWKAFCRTVDLGGEGVEASENELYFNFVFARTDQVALRNLKGASSTKIEDLQKLKKAGYNYVILDTLPLDHK